MIFDAHPASDYPLPDLVDALNHSFEEYFVPIQLNLHQFLAMVRKDSIDLTVSRLLLVNGEPSGIALVARRGWTSRLAAMGIATTFRGKGAGSWFMDTLIYEARERGDKTLMLEVIEQNEPALRLYRKFGFQTIRRLIGLVRADAKEIEEGHPDEMDVREAGRFISQFGLPDLPWQLTGETIALMTPPTRAYWNGQAYIVISNPEAEHVVIWSLLVRPDARGSEAGVNLLKAVIAKYAGRNWHAPSIYPEEFGGMFERAGFVREELSQWQMRLVLSTSA